MIRSNRESKLRRCVLCGKRPRSISTLNLAKFPLDPDRCYQWVKAVGIEDLVYVPIEKLHQLKHLCGAHFTLDSFNLAGNRLRTFAIPTLKLPNPPLSDEIMKDFPLHINNSMKMCKTKTAYKKFQDVVLKKNSLHDKSKDSNFPEIKDCRVILQKIPQIICNKDSNKSTIILEDNIYKVVDKNKLVDELKENSKSDDDNNNDGSIVEEYLDVDIFSEDDIDNKYDMDIDVMTLSDNSTMTNANQSDSEQDKIFVVDSTNEKTKQDQQNSESKHKNEKQLIKHHINENKSDLKLLAHKTSTINTNIPSNMKAKNKGTTRKHENSSYLEEYVSHLKKLNPTKQDIKTTNFVYNKKTREKSKTTLNVNKNQTKVDIKTTHIMNTNKETIKPNLNQKALFSNKEFPVDYASNNPFQIYNESKNAKNFIHQNLIYENPYPGVYVAYDRKDRNHAVKQKGAVKNYIQDMLVSRNKTTDNLEIVLENQHSVRNKTTEQNNEGLDKVGGCEDNQSQLFRKKVKNIIEEFVDHFAFIMNYKWYNDQDILIYGRQG